MEKLLIRFPKIELSYEKLVHKKVHSDLYQAIPYGKKYFAWFTWYKDNNVCIFLETNHKLHILDIFIAPVCFKHELSYNTILFGTILPNNKFYIIEDIFYYKNTNISDYNNISKLKIINNLFKDDIKQSAFTDNTIIMSIPITTTSYNDLCKEINYLPYKIYSIVCINYNQRNFKYIYKHKETPIYSATFMIKADIQNDIYNLYCLDNTKHEFYNLAYIPNYTTSVYMNSLFRNIKENICLDALEESEDEDDFENVDLDKYVDLNKSLKMECAFNNKFKMWVPIKLTNNNIITKNQLFKYEKK